MGIQSDPKVKYDLSSHQVSSYLQTKVMDTLLHEVVLDVLQHVLDLRVNLRLLQMVPNDSPYPKTWV